MLDEIVFRFNTNLSRVERLQRLYQESHGRGRGRKSVGATDVLRAATVFLHATLEDFLRSVARWRLPLASAETLDRIPLAGQQGRAERFTLGAVSRHRGKTIDEVIDASVSQFLERSNYNSTEEIVALLQAVGIDAGAMSGQFPTLDQLMKRRHLIVHRADYNPQQGRGRYYANHIAVHDLQAWIIGVRAFVGQLEARLKTLA